MQEPLFTADVKGGFFYYRGGDLRVAIVRFENHFVAEIDFGEPLDGDREGIDDEVVQICYLSRFLQRYCIWTPPIGRAIPEIRTYKRLNIS